jgi:hypothetical protein
MKKALVIAFCVFSVGIHGAESNKTAMCLVKNTLFLVTRDDMCRYTQALSEPNVQFDLMVVGSNQQGKLKKVDLNDNISVGITVLLPNKAIYTLPKTLDSSSDDDRYKPFGVDDNDLWRKANENIMECCVLQIIEPHIMYKVFENNKVETYGYSSSRRSATMPSMLFQPDFIGEDAIVQASNDLAMCYNKALTKGLKILQGKKNMRIGFAELSTEVGFPREKAAPIAFRTIIDFIKNNAEYAFVQLFIKKRCEFAQYKKLIEEYGKNVRL